MPPCPLLTQSGRGAFEITVAHDQSSFTRYATQKFRQAKASFPQLGRLKAPDLGATAIGAAVARAGVRPDEVETVVVGNVVQAGTKMNPSRQAAVHGAIRRTG